MSKINLPILLVLYNPSKICLERVESLKTKVDFYIFDNSDFPFYFPCENIRYFKSSLNLGISGGIKWMVSQCIIDNKDFFLFLDQDTIFSLETAVFISSDFKSNNSNVVICHYASEEKERGLVRFIINSGTVFSKKFLMESNFVLDRYFVDAIDLGLCQLARHMGYEVFSKWAPGIDHISDQGYFEVNFWIFKIKLKCYPTWRKKEFYKAHFRLLYDSIFVYKSFFDTLLILKYLIEFSRGQFLARLFKSILSIK